MNFQTFGFHPTLEATINDIGFVEATPIQADGIPAILEGRDLLGLAQTGTGKTAAFLLPILHNLEKRGGGTARALIVAPTRELCEQIHRAAQEFSTGLKTRSMTIYGGVPYPPQLKGLKEGVEIIVATPGRLLDHIQKRNLDTSSLEVLVLDEADQMFDMGFLPDIRKILSKLPRERQNLLFSATMPPGIRGLAEEILNDPVSVEIAHSRPTNTVSHALYPVGEHQKSELLMKLLRQTDAESVLIFAKTRSGCEFLGKELQRADFSVKSLQGDLPQKKRQRVLDGFREGEFQILVATDIAARGLDISRVSHVINFDFPPTVDDYTHRIGRTGRAASTGDAFTLVTHQDAGKVRAIEEVLGEEIEVRRFEDFPYTGPNPFTRSIPAPRRPRRPGRRRL
ncbi:MAG: DEAD/DEAH box helicase [Candidatus Krumholzibacteria bacterium]|nr:DEAD/DEAH box helicase [Candidatus Krumholzibacteria bacterium]MDP6668524.1 DEAD/DEAH box helicase [Candidatus Krumholzibacteria bacterium]MDP6797802.1 DEAD/DEAH box helicase [Candidatus Krumholzibacteria bacterium]MDP7021405.1 DEAD/DEAH box helicase [Candidatus Krumholzibacteria bacterium]